MEIVRVAAGGWAMIERGDVFGADVNDIMMILQAAFDDEKRFMDDEEPLLLEELRCDDGVGHAGFVFKTHEGETFSGARTLPANN